MYEGEDVNQSSNSAPRELFFYAAGMGFMALAKAKHLLRGYTTPKPFPVSQTDRCIDYDVEVVEDWLRYYPDIQGKDILELGPGSDLGIGCYLLKKGAARYYAVDRHPLAHDMSSAWVAFARTGNPNHAGLPAWDVWTPTRRATMVFDTTTIAIDDPWGDERRAVEAARKQARP